MKYILLFFLLIIAGCSLPKQEWQVSLDNIKEITVTDYYDNQIELEEDEYLKLLELFNKQTKVTLNEELTDTAVFGKPIYSMRIIYENGNKFITFSELGFISIWENYDQYGTYYDIDLFDEFYDEFKEVLKNNDMVINNMLGICCEDDFVQLPFSDGQDYLIGCQMRIFEFYDEIGLNHNFSKDLTVGEYLQINHPYLTMNDVIKIDNVIYKILDVKNGKIISSYARVNKK